jgi:hypothetical protein
MVALLGLAVIVIGVRLPASVDLWAERLVGLTLLVLGGYILATLFRPGDHIPKSRYMLLHKGIYRVGRLVSFRRNGQDAAQYVPPPAFDARSIFFVGIVHGLGAETPSQLMIFLLAVHLGGTFLGIVGLGTFIAGLLIMNTLMTASAAGVFGAAHDRPIVRRTLFAFTGIYSFAMGVLFIGGRSFLLP